MENIDVIVGDAVGFSGYDAVINYLNESLSPIDYVMGKSFSKKLYKEAGKDLKKACKAINNQDSCKVGQAVITSAFELSYKHIVHTVLPDKKEEGPDWWMLAECFTHSLEEVVKQGDRTVVIPVPEVYYHGLSRDKARTVVVCAVRDFCRKHLEKLDKVVFVLPQSESTYSEKYQQEVQKRLQEISDQKRMGFASFKIEIDNYSMQPLYQLPLPNIVIDAIKEFLVKKGTKTLEGLLHLAPLRKVVNRILIKKGILIEITEKGIDITYIDLMIKAKDIHIIGEDCKMKLMIDIDEVNLTQGINQLMEKGLIKDDMVRMLLSSINAAPEEEKYRLLQSVIEWGDTNQVYKRMLEGLQNSDTDIGKKLAPWELKLGSIKLL